MTFIEGVRLFELSKNAPDFVIARGVITPNELVAFLKNNPKFLTEYEGAKQVKFQILTPKEGGAPYMSLDTFKPNSGEAPKKDDDSDLPF